MNTYMYLYIIEREEEEKDGAREVKGERSGKNRENKREKYREQERKKRNVWMKGNRNQKI